MEEYEPSDIEGRILRVRHSAEVDDPEDAYAAVLDVWRQAGEKQYPTAESDGDGS